MTLQDQTCTAEQGARLVELGVKPVATFYHMPGKSEKHGPYIQYGWSSDAIAPAFGVAELGDMLPKGLYHNGGTMYSWYHRNNWRGHSVGYTAAGYPSKNLEREWFENEAEARADLLIHVLEGNMACPPPHWLQNPNDAAELLKVKKAKEALCSQKSVENAAG